MNVNAVTELSTGRYCKLKGVQPVNNYNQRAKHVCGRKQLQLKLNLRRDLRLVAKWSRKILCKYTQVTHNPRQRYPVWLNGYQETVKAINPGYFNPGLFYGQTQLNFRRRKKLLLFIGKLADRNVTVAEKVSQSFHIFICTTSLSSLVYCHFSPQVDDDFEL